MGVEVIKEMKQVLPPIECELKRKRVAPDSQFKAACVKPKLTKSSKKLKNLEGHRALGEVFGRVHVRQQNLKTLKLKFSKKIKKSKNPVKKIKKKSEEIK